MPTTMTILDLDVVDTRKAVSQGNGDHHVMTHEGMRLFAEVKDGKVVGYHVKTAKGRVDGMYVRMVDEPASKISDQRPARCVYCGPDPEGGIGWICWPIGCQGGW